MSDWTSGYVAAANIAYTHGYYSELNPLRVRLALLNAGLLPPEPGPACELGFGQGITVNIHAAASAAEWWGTDFNPAQAGLAQDTARAADSGAHLFDQSFEEFCARTDLPEFHFIGLHGIWSWISAENRAVIVDFVRRRLKVGGVLYISYNCMPGWAAFAPMRDLLAEHAEVMAAPGRGILNRVDAALDFADKLMKTNPAYARANPQIPDRLSRIRQQNANYLAHEYFNRYWEPESIAQIRTWMEPAKVDFACSANLLDHIPDVNLTPEQHQFLLEIPDVMFRETVRDFMVNQQFRRDYWVKGARRMTPIEQLETMRAQRVVLSFYRPDVSLKTTGALGEATMNEPIYRPILDYLADYQPRTIAEIEEAIASAKIPLPQVVQAIMVLAGSGQIQPAQEPKAASAARATTSKLNALFYDKARGSGDIGYLASPVTGGGIGAPRFTQLFLLALARGKRTPAEWAAFAWDTLSSQGERLLKDGKALETPEQNLAELRQQANDMEKKQLPIFRALGVV